MSDERLLNTLLKALNTTKFNDLICALFSRHASKLYSSAGRHLHFNRSITTFSGATRPIFPKIELNDR